MDELDIPTSENLSPPEHPADHADELWQTLAYTNGRIGGFDPETLLHLGEIEHLYMERVREDDTSEEGREFEHWTVEPGDESTAWPNAQEEPIHHRVDAVKITAQGQHQHDKQFDRFTAAWPGADDTKPRILLERARSSAPDSGDQLFEKTYPLYLY